MSNSCSLDTDPTDDNDFVFDLLRLRFGLLLPFDNDLIKSSTDFSDVRLRDRAFIKACTWAADLFFLNDFMRSSMVLSLRWMSRPISTSLPKLNSFIVSPILSDTNVDPDDDAEDVLRIGVRRLRFLNGHGHFNLGALRGRNEELDDVSRVEVQFGDGMCIGDTSSDLAFGLGSTDIQLGDGMYMGDISSDLAFGLSADGVFGFGKTGFAVHLNGSWSITELNGIVRLSISYLLVRQKKPVLCRTLILNDAS